MTPQTSLAEIIKGAGLPKQDIKDCFSKTFFFFFFLLTKFLAGGGPYNRQWEDSIRSVDSAVIAGLPGSVSLCMCAVTLLDCQGK
jgi:hypothetical protein